MNHQIETTNTDAELMPFSAPSNDTLDDLKRQVEAMQAARQVAEAMCNTKMVPKAYQGQPDDGAAAILYGAELGLGAIQSLQQVMVINGKPGVEARTMVALLRSHGFQFDVQEDTNEAVTVVGTAPSGETHTSRWTIEDAQTAGYTSNALYKKIPRTMLYAKAATEVCRRLGSHILSGIAYSVEELQLHEPTVKATATRQPASGGVAALKARAKEPQPQQEIEQGPVDNQPDLAAELTTQIGQQTTEEGLGKVMADAADLLETGDIDQATYDTVRDTGRTKWQELQA